MATFFVSRSSSLFWYTIILFGAIPLCHISVVVSLTLQSDIQTLRSIKEAIDPNTVSSTSFVRTWKFNSDPCETTGSHFLGILCTIPEENSSARVSVIDLNSDGLEGFLTPAIGNLTELRILDLRSNRFRGPIPRTISKLRKLTKLLLSDNFFSGGIPAGLSMLRGLEDIDLSRNKLSGSISINISGLKSLTHLRFSGNQLSGKIPDLSAMWRLKTLDLSSNQLRGSLPQLPSSLSTLRLDHNLISGLVSSIKSLHRLQTLDLSDNRFSGSLEGNLLTLPELTSINVSANVFRDIKVTKHAGQASQLQVLSAHHNRLHGHLPLNLIDYGSLREIYLGHNLFSGWIPRQYGPKLDGSWRSLFLEFNFLQGSPPPEFMHSNRRIRGSLAHNCLRSCPGNTTFCRGGQKQRSDCILRIRGGKLR